MATRRKTRAAMDRLLLADGSAADLRTIDRLDDEDLELMYPSGVDGAYRIAAFGNPASLDLMERLTYQLFREKGEGVDQFVDALRADPRIGLSMGEEAKLRKLGSIMGPYLVARPGTYASRSRKAAALALADLPEGDLRRLRKTRTLVIVSDADASDEHRDIAGSPLRSAGWYSYNRRTVVVGENWDPTFAAYVARHEVGHALTDMAARRDPAAAALRRRRRRPGPRSPARRLPPGPGLHRRGLAHARGAGRALRADAARGHRSRAEDLGSQAAATAPPAPAYGERMIPVRIFANGDLLVPAARETHEGTLADGRKVAVRGTAEHADWERYLRDTETTPLPLSADEEPLARAEAAEWEAEQ